MPINHPNRSKNRGRGASGITPTAAEVRAARGTLTQEDAAALIYTSGRRWRSYESGESRMHPSAYELFNLKIGAQ